MQHWSRITCICRGLCALFRRHWSWLPTSIVACEHQHIHFRVGCAHRSGEFCHDLRASVRWHEFWYACIVQVTLVVSCAHRPSDIDQLQDTIPKAYTYQSWSMCTDSIICFWPAWISQVTSTNDRPHQSKSSRIWRGLCTSGKQHRTTT